MVLVSAFNTGLPCITRQLMRLSPRFLDIQCAFPSELNFLWKKAGEGLPDWCEKRANDRAIRQLGLTGQKTQSV